MGWKRLGMGLVLIVTVGANAGCDSDSTDDGGGDVPVDRTPDEQRDSGPGGDTDAGDIDDEDAGSMGPIVTCQEVPWLTGPSAAADGLTSTSEPADFEVTRVSVGFECEAPALVLTLSGGNCPNGNGHALTIALDTASIEGGTLPQGPTTIDEQRSGIEIRYTRRGAPAPGGTWGNCGTGDQGTLNLVESPPLEAGGVLEGGYQLTLPPCEGGKQADISVIGYFKATLEQSFADACP